MAGTISWSFLFPSAYPLNAITIEKVWIVTNARDIIAAYYKTPKDLCENCAVQKQYTNKRDDALQIHFGATFDPFDLLIIIHNPKRPIYSTGV